MIALTVRQPWAYAIAAGLKPIENRTWTTRHRGLLAIHASARWDGPDAAARVFELSGQYVMKAPASAIVGVAELVDVCVAREGCECGPWAIQGQCHWRLENARQLVEPVECKGRLGLWPLTPPGAGGLSEVERAVLAQIGANA